MNLHSTPCYDVKCKQILFSMYWICTHKKNSKWGIIKRKYSFWGLAWVMQPPTHFTHTTTGETPTCWIDVFAAGIDNGVTLSNTHGQWQISNRAEIIRAINPIIPVPEGRGQIARCVLLQGIGVGLPDLDLLVSVCKSIWILPTSDEQMHTGSLIHSCNIERLQPHRISHGFLW